jgi:hypothetical protein
LDALENASRGANGGASEWCGAPGRIRTSGRLRSRFNETQYVVHHHTVSCHSN